MDDEPIQFMSAKHIAAKMDMHHSTVRKLAERGDFPKPVKVANCKNVRWLKTEVDAWCKEQLERRSL